MPISIPADKEQKSLPKQLACLEDGTDIFKMFGADPYQFDARAVRRNFHRLSNHCNPDKLGREATPAENARYLKLKQAYTVIMDDQLRAMYRQHCFGIAGTGGCEPLGHEAALSKALVLARELRKMGEERAIVLHKASETGWSQQQKDSDGRNVRGDQRKAAHQFNLFGDISSSDEDVDNEKERRQLSVEQILERSPKYADIFLEKAKAILLDSKVSKPAAGGAFVALEKPKVMEWLKENPKTIQKLLRKLRTAVKQMNWAMTALIQHKDSPWRGLEVKASLVEHGVTKLLEIVKSGLAFGKFTEVHEQEFEKLLDNVHRVYMDLFERRGQELLRAAIKAEPMVVHLLPDAGGRLPDGTRVVLQELGARADLNGKGGSITAWDYSLQRYTVELEKDKPKEDQAALLNPDLLGADEDEEDEEEDDKPALAIPKKLMVMPKNVEVDLKPCARRLESLLRDWNTWRKRPRSVSATQDAEAVAAALGPPLESMANYIQEASSAVGTASEVGRDGMDLTADMCRDALMNARNLAAKLLGEEPKEPPAPPPMAEPQHAVVAMEKDSAEDQALKLAAEVAQASLGQINLAPQKKKKKKKGRSSSGSRSRSRRRRRKRSSSSE